MVRIGTPSQPDRYVCTDNPDDILKIHQAGFAPEWREESCVYFKKSHKLKKYLEKHGIDCE